MLTNFPPLVEDILVVAGIGLLSTIVFLSGKQDLRNPAAVSSAWIEWTLGALFIAVPLFAAFSNGRPVEFVGLLIVGGAYGHAVMNAYRRYLASSEQKE